MATRDNYQIAANTLEELLSSLNFHMQSIADRLDKIEGIRGTSNIESTLDMNSNNIDNIDSVTATSGTLTSGTITTLNVNDITLTGDLLFDGDDTGLVYGEITAEANSTETVISSANTQVQITIFNTNSHAHHVTVDHTEDHIEIERDGHYLIVCSAAVESVAGAASKFSFYIKKNNGAADLVPHVSRNIAGGGGQAGVISLSGLAELVAGDTVECWIINESNTANYIIEDISLTVLQVGGV
jgi:hypothetical protein